MRKSVIFYDLSEALGVGTGRLKYYGIARVVVELGIELAKLDTDVRFVIFSPGHRRFCEVHPILDESSYGGIDLRLPHGQGPSHLRAFDHDPKGAFKFITKMARASVRLKNRWRWMRAGLPTRPVSLDGQTLISAVRPKLMVAMLDALSRSGESIDFVPLLHDMIPLHDFKARYAKRFPRNFLADNRYVIERARLVLANSQFTYDDIHRFAASGELPRIAAMVAVPLAHECRASSEAPQMTAPDGPYLLAVGAQTGRKNLEAILEAMLDYDERYGSAPKLVLAGAVRQRVQTYLNLPRFGSIRTRVLQVANPGQADLVMLYKGASALVLASRIEGWGLPAAEALWFGIPALCSTAPVLAEVCGPAAFYFDPDRPDQLADLIDKIMRGDTPPKPKTLRSWADVARDVIDAVRER